MRAVTPIIDLWSGLRSRRLVLPRAFRRPFRILSRMEWRPPRHAELKLGAGLLIATILGGIVLGGHVESVLAYATARTGLTIDEVRITGQTETSEIEVLNKLAIADGTSLATFDVAAARARVETLPWVAQVTLAKIYPSTLQVVIAEKTAFAIWHHGETTSLIDRGGAVITDGIDNERYAGLPMVVGEGAAPRAPEAVAMIATEQSLAKQVNAAVLVAGRRWTILMDGGIEILLPEAAPAAAWHRVATLDAQTGLLSRAITRVDLRDPGRLVLRLSDEGVAKREAILKRAAPGKRGGAA